MKTIAPLVAALLLAAVLPARAAPAEVPAATDLIVDQAHALHDEARAGLSVRLKTIQDSGRAQVAILIAGGTASEPLADYALRVAEAWKLGRAGRDDGLLIVVLPAQRAARIEVGYGLEGEITDALASQWIDKLVPALKEGRLEAGLAGLLDDVEAKLPAPAPEKKPSGEENYLFPDHPEWRLPFVLVIFSMFSLFPLMAGRWGGVASAFLLAAFYGTAAWSLWDSRDAGIAAAAIAFPLPLLWALNWSDDARLPRLLLYAKGFGNFCGVLLFFAIITLFVGVGIDAAGLKELWAAPLFAGILALGLAAFLFPRVQEPLMVVLRSVMHFALILTFAYLGLGPLVDDPAAIAFSAAAAFTTLVAAALYLDARERARSLTHEGTSRWSLWLIGLALAIAVPFGLLVLVQAALGTDLRTQLTHAAAGGGTIGGILMWAARLGFFAAVNIGLGGRFGGGGTDRGD